MRRIYLAGTLFLATLSWGYAGDAAPDRLGAVAGPHQGTMVRMPDEQGFAELVNEPEPRDRRGDESVSLVVYFLQIDAKSPLEPAPTDVAFAASAGAGSRDSRARKVPPSIPLVHEPKAGDPAGTGRFASRPGPYRLEGARGTLTARIDRKEIQLQVSGGR